MDKSVYFLALTAGYTLLFFLLFLAVRRDYHPKVTIPLTAIFQLRVLAIFLLGLLSLFLMFFHTVPLDSSLFMILFIIILVAAQYYSLQSSMLRISVKSNKMMTFNEEIEKFLQIMDKNTNKLNFVREIEKFFQRILRVKHFVFFEITDDIQPFKLVWYNEVSFEQLKKIDMFAQDFYHLLKSNLTTVPISVKACPVDFRQFLQELHLEYMIPLVYQNSVQGVILVGFGNSRKEKPVPEEVWRMMSHQISPRLAILNVISKEVEVQKMADLGQMASQIAHDFKSFLTLIRMNISGDEMIERQVNYMSKLVKDLSEYTRVRSSEKMLADIHGIIDASLDTVQIPDNVKVEKNYSPEIPKTLLDPVQMQRVFINLIENSIRAMPDGGKIRINTRLIKSIASREKRWIYIEFMDEGQGIPEENLSRIFEPFYTTNKKKGGTGMGLAITKQIIKEHAGFIDVTSKPGKGTIFNIRIPATETQNQDEG